MLADLLIPVIIERYSSGACYGKGCKLARSMGTLADIVTPNFITVAPEDTLGEVAERMTRQNTGAVVVKDFGRMIGILTERDMLRAMAARVHTSDARVRQWMTADPMTATADMTLDDAAQVMLDNGFRHLPVVDGSNVLGVVSLRRVMGGRRQPAPEAGLAFLPRSATRGGDALHDDRSGQLLTDVDAPELLRRASRSA